MSNSVVDITKKMNNLTLRTNQLKDDEIIIEVTDFNNNIMEYDVKKNEMIDTERDIFIDALNSGKSNKQSLLYDDFMDNYQHRNAFQGDSYYFK